MLKNKSMGIEEGTGLTKTNLCKRRLFLGRIDLLEIDLFVGKVAFSVFIILS